MKFAQSHGYKIKVLKGYRFNRLKSPFTSYINDVYRVKSHPENDAQKTMAKSLLNNLLGRFGIKLGSSETHIVSQAQFNKIFSLCKVNSHYDIPNDRALVNYSGKLDADIIKANNIDRIKVAQKVKYQESPDITRASIGISAAINPYAGIHMSQIKLDLLLFYFLDYF